MSGKVRHLLPSMLTGLVVAMVTKARSLREVEQRTGEIAAKHGRWQGIGGRIADNTFGRLLSRLRLAGLVACLAMLANVLLILGVAVQVISARQSESAVTLAGEKFLPSLSFDFYRDRQNASSYSWMDASDVSTTASSSLSGSLNQNLPFGGSLTLGLSGGMNESNSRFQTVNPYYSGRLSFQLTQPLLRNFRIDSTRYW